MSSPSDEGFVARLQLIRSRMDRAAHGCGRVPRSVRLIGVAKRQPEASIAEALQAGLQDIGENFVQEWSVKAQRFGSDSVRWHFIGALQRNKVKHLVGRVHLIHSVDRLRLLKEIDRHAVAQGCTQGVLLQVNVALEATKGGLAPVELSALFDAALEMTGIQVRGLMIFPPAVADPEAVRPWFRAGRALLEELRARTPAGVEPPNELSMGMSHDFEVAIEEGATLIRIGTALFGARSHG